jgi:hypothetical protein
MREEVTTTSLEEAWPDLTISTVKMNKPMGF